MTHNDFDPDNANDDPFVRRLRAQRPAALPAHWRADILAAARLAAIPAPGTTRWQQIAAALGPWLWPHPRTYAVLSAVWLLILAFRLATPTPAPSAVAHRFATAAEQMDYPLVLAREQLAINTALAASSRPGEARP